MRCARSTISMFLVAVLSALFSAAGTAQDVGEKVAKRGTFGDDVYSAGGTVEVQAHVMGDVVAAGGTVVVEGRVDADIVAAGGTVKITSSVGDDVRAAGGEVDLDAKVGDDVVAAGGRVRLGPNANVGGKAWLAGAEVVVDGTVAGELKAAAQVVRISGHIDGDVVLTAQQVEILPGARIKGALLYHSPHKAAISSKAQVDGPITYAPMPPPRRPAGAVIVFLITLTVAGIVLFLLFPRYTTTAADTVFDSPWQSLGLGFVTLVATPFVAIALMVVVLGVWVGLALLAFYLVALPVGFLIGVFSLVFFANRKARPLGVSKRLTITVLVIVLAILGLVRLIPVLGGLIWFLLLLLGMGAGVIQLYRIYLGQPAATSGDQSIEGGE